MTDLASIAAATAAGYIYTQTDRGASRSPRYVSQLEKNLRGQTGKSGALWRAEGASSVATTADVNVLAALNGQRNFRYGAGTGTNNDLAGNALTRDAS